MNQLNIEKLLIPYKGNDGEEYQISQAEFIVDGNPLADVLSFSAERPWFGRTFFEDSEAVMNNELTALLGESLPANQFGSHRFILYRCHCGSDYCGVISCVVERKGDFILWKDIRYENDDNDTQQLVIPEFRFLFIAYTKVINTFVAEKIHSKNQ